MSMDLFLKSSCGGCGSSSDLYGSNCKHMTLCLSCGKKMAEAHAKCFECGAFITRLIREYHVKASTNVDKTYYIGRFATGLPSFSKKKNAEARWSLHREGLQGRQLTDSLREKYKNKPWLLEDETGQYQYHGHVEGAQSATYYLLMMQGKEFVAIPAGSWYNFNKVAQYKQLTLEEAEEKMKNRRRNAEGYQRWMMKIAANGAAAFGETLKEPQDVVKSESGRRKKGSGNEKDDVALSDKDEEKDGEEEESRKRRLGLNKKTRDDDEEGPRGGDLDFDDDDIEKGDDWEHEENFTDDDEAVGNDPEERDELPIDVPAPPEIKQDDEEEEEGNEEGGGLSKSGKELKKLLGRTSGLNDSDVEDDDDDDDIEDEVEVGLSPVLAPKQKEEPKDEPIETNLSKTTPTGSSRGTALASKSVKTKRKPGGDDVKGANGTPLKKLKTENESKASTKDEPASTSKTSVQSRGSVPLASKSTGTPSVGPVTEDEIRAVLLNMAPVTTQELVANFRGRLKSHEDKGAFADILKRISKIQKTNGSNYVVLRDK